MNLTTILILFVGFAASVLLAASLILRSRELRSARTNRETVNPRLTDPQRLPYRRRRR